MKSKNYGKLTKILKLFKSPNLLFSKIKDRIIFNILPVIIFNDYIYLKLHYRLMTGKKLNLKPPKTFNEKTQWLKLYDRKSIYTVMADKYNSYEYVKQRIGSEYVIPLLGVWNSIEEINFNSLPNQFVLKCTHDSGGVVICKDKEKFVFIGKDGNTLGFEEVKDKLTKSLKKDYSLKAREWTYKNIIPRIIAQEYIKSENNDLLMDYKIFTFNGKPKLIQVHIERTQSSKIANFYSTDWILQDFCIQELNDKNYSHEKPRYLDKMLQLSEILSQDTFFVRVDFFYVNDIIYFGEFAFYNHGGFGKFNPQSYDEILGSYIKLPINT